MVISSGARGSSVRSLQQDLAARGYNPGGADGVFGRKTAEAVRAFQADQGLTVDGKVGPATQRALEAARQRDTFEPAAPTAADRPQARPVAAEPQAPTAANRPQARPVAGELPYQAMARFAQSEGFTVTSTTGGHHLGWAHRAGHAVDVRTSDHTRAQVDAFIRDARAQGYTVIDERRGGNSAWSGPHVHLQM